MLYEYRIEYNIYVYDIYRMYIHIYYILYIDLIRIVYIYTNIHMNI